jgi:hypothetical protein
MVAFHRDGTVSGKRGSHDTLTTAQTGVPDEPATPSRPRPQGRGSREQLTQMHRATRHGRLVDSNCADSPHTLAHSSYAVGRRQTIIA